MHGVEKGYYADGEDAYDMRKVLTRAVVGLPPLQATEGDQAILMGTAAESKPAAASASATGAGGGAGASEAESK